MTNTLAYCSNQFSPGCITSNVHKRTIREGALREGALREGALRESFNIVGALRYGAIREGREGNR